MLPQLNKVGLVLAHLEWSTFIGITGLLDREKQPHSDFFTHLSIDFEEKLDFNKDEPFDLSEYDQYFEWDETEYMRLRFIAARHYASHGHWDDAYAYILRTRPDDIPQHEDTYSRNAQVWRVGGQGRKITPKSPHTPNKESQKEERDSVIDAVKLITLAQTETHLTFEENQW